MVILPCLPVTTTAVGVYADWYAIQTRLQREQAVIGQIHDEGLETFWPHIQEEKRWSDRSKIILRPLFPGYVFARLTNHGARTANWHYRFCTGVLGLRGNPEVVPDREIAALRQAIASRLKVERCPYTTGAHVLVKSGPLAGVYGIVERINGETRITISCKLLQRSVRVQVDAADLEAAA